MCNNGTAYTPVNAAISLSTRERFTNLLPVTRARVLASAKRVQRSYLLYIAIALTFHASRTHETKEREEGRD